MTGAAMKKLRMRRTTTKSLRRRIRSTPRTTHGLVTEKKTEHDNDQAAVSAAVNAAVGAAFSQSRINEARTPVIIVVMPNVGANTENDNVGAEKKTKKQLPQPVEQKKCPTLVPTPRTTTTKAL